MSTWQVELNNVESKLRDLVLYEFVEKLHIKHLTVYLKNVWSKMIGCWKLEYIWKDMKKFYDENIKES